MTATYQVPVLGPTGAVLWMATALLCRQLIS